MKNDSIVHVTPALELSVSTPEHRGEIRVKLTRVGAQCLAAALRNHAGVAFSQEEKDLAHFGSGVPCEAVVPKAHKPTGPIYYNRPAKKSGSFRF